MSYQRIVILPDIHTPNYENSALKPVLSFIRYYKPHTLIQLGDLCDWDSLSNYEVQREQDIVNIQREVDSANLLLDEIDNATPRNSKKIIIGGNHEARYSRFKANEGSKVEDKKLRYLTDWKQEYELYTRNWDSFEYGQHVQIGKVVFTHGWFASGNSAKKMAECFPGRNVIYGHTHRHEVHGTMDERGLPIEAESIGTLSRFDLSYLKGKPPINWVHGFMYIDMLDSGKFSKHFVHIIEGKFIEHNREFA